MDFTHFFKGILTLQSPCSKCSLQLIAYIALYISLFLPPYYSTTLLSCSIFSSLHYFLLTFLQYFLLSLTFSNMNFNIEEDSSSLFSEKTLASWLICNEF